MTRALAAALLLAGCGPAAAPRGGGEGGGGAGERLEAAATAAGLVADPARRPLVGVWALGTDRACVVPRADGTARLGVAVAYDDGQGCAGSGTVARLGADRLDVRLGTDAAGGCRFAARFSGERIAFPPELPAGCDRLCIGRASLAAVALERQSESAAEAAALRDGRGRPLCVG